MLRIPDGPSIPPGWTNASVPFPQKASRAAASVVGHAEAAGQKKYNECYVAWGLHDIYGLFLSTPQFDGSAESARKKQKGRRNGHQPAGPGELHTSQLGAAHELKMTEWPRAPSGPREQASNSRQRIKATRGARRRC